MPSRYASLSRAELAVLVPELLLAGHLVDRSGMAWCLAAWGRQGMTEIAIEEWAAASPVYTRRMQRALGFEPPSTGGDVVTIFKGLQLDIGAPPQFMDFRFAVKDPWHGEFRLDHCGALMDVEPLGPSYVRAMCHDIEDPTFDATAVATNPRAQVRPVHRPPRVPADRSPHCAWTVVIDPEHPEATPSAGCLALQQSRAAMVELEPIDTSEEGQSDYSGQLLSDLDFGAFSHSALVRIADEVALQAQLLDLGFVHALRGRGNDDEVREIATKQLVGIAGLTAERLRRALGLPADVHGALRVLAAHPLVNPAAYVEAHVDETSLSVTTGAAHEDGGWISLCGPESAGLSPRPLQAVVRAVDPALDVEVTGDAGDWTMHVVRRDTIAPELEEVAVTKISTGAGFAFEPRRSLPITPA